MISRITPNFTSQSQSKNSNNVAFSADLLGKSEVTRKAAGLTIAGFNSIVSLASGICGRDTFTLATEVMHGSGNVLKITHTPAATTKGLSEVSTLFFPDEVGEKKIVDWMQRRNTEWLNHN